MLSMCRIIVRYYVDFTLDLYSLFSKSSVVEKKNERTPGLLTSSLTAAKYHIDRLKFHILLRIRKSLVESM
jgi:hypothetical protein